ncbi:sulfurtransferase complex subunit TusB [Shewanella subflava]|uniref:Sulfurtransferase complex subunit TusB n=1 Tax=Shewanella subflava TaxID=2986476 RepID=A0ABT3IDI7_9GAMM|nr:sulfurtransferase complex subunit TusB [Shewanella subflava]MCW3173949.1 sulfurtransferase complex subunit TusB [Shewanella subflava]
MILHHIQTSPSHDNAMRLCLRYIRSGDSIILTADAVNVLLYQEWLNLLTAVPVYVLKDEIEARGLAGKLADISNMKINVIDVDEFVNQTLHHSKVITW